jgi:NADH-quinone oxidoreductase subunit C
VVILKTDRSSLSESIRLLKKEGYDYLTKITAVDYVDHITVIYFLRDFSKLADLELEFDVNPADLWVPTIMEHHPSADWYERELYEMFGIEIKGRRAKRLILEKWDGKGSPLRKNFKWGEPYESMG